MRKNILQSLNSLSKRLLAVIIFLFSFIQYSNTFTHDYTWDDHIVIVENERVQQGISGIPELFLLYRSDQLSDQYGYRPITLSSFALDISFFGINPKPAHITNALYYGILCLLLFLFLNQLFSSYSKILLFAITLLFVVHPLHVEAVANIKSRDEIFALLFGLSSFIFFIQYVQAAHISRKIGLFLLSTLFFLCAILSKENAISFLAIYPFLPFCLKSSQSIRQKLISSLPILLPILLGILFVWVLPRSQALDASNYDPTTGAGIYHEDPILGNSLYHIQSLVEIIPNTLNIFLKYIQNFLLPYPLVYYYGYNQIPVTGWGNPLIYLSLVLHIGMIVWGILSFRTNRILSFAVGFYFATISVYSQLFVHPPDTMADRFLFTPSVALCILLVIGLASLFRIPLQNESLQKAKKIPYALPYLAILSLCILAFSVLSFQRNKVWKDNLTLFEHDMPYLENCARAHYYYAGALSTEYESARQQQQTARMKELAPKIIHHFQRSIEISPESYYSYIKLGRMYMARNRFEDATQILEEVIAKYPDQARPYYHLGFAYHHLQQFDQAVPLLEKSLELAPKREDTHFYLIQDYFRNNQPEKARELAQQAINRFPQTLQFYDLYADLLLANQQIEEAVAQLEIVMQIQPGHQGAYQKAIGIYQRFGTAEQVEAFKQKWN